MPLTTDAATSTFAGFQAAMSAGDAAGVAALLAEDVELVSPLTDRLRFRGRASVAALLADVHASFDGLAYVDRLIDGERAVLRSRATVRGAELDELALVELDGDHLIARLTIFTRPLPATAAVVRELTPRVARSRAGAGNAFGAARLGGLVTKTVNLTDRLGARAMRGREGIESGAARRS